MITKIDKLLYDKNLGKFFINIDGQIVEVKTGSGEGGSILIDGAVTPNSTHAVSGKTVYDAIQAAVQGLEVQIEEHSVDPESVIPTVTQEASTQSGGDNIITFTFPNGDTTEVVIKNGAQGNSGVASADEVVVVNNLTEGGTTVTEGGVTKVKVLSAEMGKELAQQSLIESGTFAKAYLKAVDVNVPFPWVLKDTDGNGNVITKMIWHIGNREFVDAAGADVNWYKDGITVITDGPCCLHVAHANNSSRCKDIIIPKAGLTTIPFSELKQVDSDTLGTVMKGWFIKTTTEIVDGEETIIPVQLSNQLSLTSSDISLDVLYVNFGGLTVTNGFSFYSAENSKLKAVDNLVMQGSVLNWNFWLNRCPNIKHIGNVSGGPLSWRTAGQSIFFSSLAEQPYMTKLDVKNLVAPIFSVGMMPNLNYLDIRGMNPKLCGEYTLDETKLSNMANLKTLIIGDFDTSTIIGDGGKAFLEGNISNLTLVCTHPTPPATNQNGYIINELLNKATTILVHPGSLAAYKAASIWSNYQSKMSEYSQGEY